MTTTIVFPLLFAALFAVGSCGIPGGFSYIDPNSPNFRKAMNFAVSDYNMHIDDVYYHKATAVLKAKSQVVAGQNIFMSLELARTRCMKNDPSANYCPLFYPQQVMNLLKN
uniref:Cystatin domain-containing protein n=1 Tax=Nothobranchius furzeri TaxID=105023 RepID=A0A8C6M084_NOTFU